MGFRKIQEKFKKGFLHACKNRFFLTGLFTIINAFQHSGISFSVLGIFIATRMLVSPISKSEFTIFLMYFCSDFFFNWQTEKKKLYWTNQKFVFFFNCSNWEQFMEQIGVTNWWKHLMNSLRQKNCRANEKMQGEEKNWQDNRNRKWLLKQWQNENIACNKKAVRNGILLPKVFWSTVKKKISSDREFFLNFETERRMQKFWDH